MCLVQSAELSPDGTRAQAEKQQDVLSGRQCTEMAGTHLNADTESGKPQNLCDDAPDRSGKEVFPAQSNDGACEDGHGVEQTSQG